MSRIGWAIRDTMSIEDDASRVSVRERGRPSFQFLLNARDPTPGILICACCGANAFYRPHRACAYGP